ncbi:hybrid non-ribosomal peptide synthetase/type I polyketide synthase [Streptomyces sp. XY006]|uniref:hybrid non-ribosomal peptide synthetase/type I polyketide synthase n=1 Tax=Streptomyces sp. XY006 TaxID=2021410 RepID=UPI000B8C244B|nr:hybrid non-ribosomal peptide synthetase/type I polyketide synthase [Streptomyces sp. XY006]OXS34485.1 non-ribosomal peptide synthetase [Streptomyces sp. XY006]
MSDDTLWNVLRDAARERPEQVTAHVRGDGSEAEVTYRDLLTAARRVAGGLRAAGVRPGTCVPLVADRSEDFQVMFWGLVGADLVPVPLAADVRRVLPVWEHLDRPPLFVDTAGEDLLRHLPAGAPVLRLEEVRDGDDLGEPTACAPDGLAFVQFSSGSTGVPKGVELTHAAVLANLRQILAVSDLGPDDVLVSWMPYFHDMGLIGTHLAPLAARAKQVKIGPLAFARRPAIWFETATAHRATHLSAANFALALATRRLSDEDMARFDLTSVRRVVVGAEPISASVWRDFARRTGPAGLAPHALQPVYGLAEATLAVTFPPPGETAEPMALDRAALSRGRAVEAPDADGAAVELMDLGHPVPGCAVRIVDDTGRVLGDRRVGHIQVRGPQTARGYRALPDATAAAFTADGWLRTGDMGFLRDGRLCVTGRYKDVLFLNGLKHHAADLEDVAAATPGLPPGTAAVVGSTDPDTGGERVVVFVSWSRPPRTADEVLERVAARVGEALFHDDVRVVALPPGQFPRTTSGKVRRHVLRDRFEAGRYSHVVVRRRGTAPAAPTGRRAPGGAGVPRSRAAIEQVVREVWAEVLGTDGGRIDPHASFRTLGGTSLKAMEVLAALEDAFGTPLETAALRAGADTVAGLVDHLLGLRADSGAGDGAYAGVPGGPGGEPSRVPSGGPDRQGREADRQGREAGPQGRAGLAVVGLACRFPGAQTPEAYWRLLAEGRDLVTPVPPHRWDGDRVPAARWGAFLKDPAGFDTDRFGMSADEARTLDPQARLLLELAHEALERAGYAGPRRRAHRIGVFTTTGDSGYRELLDRAADDDGTDLPPSALTGNLPNLLAARVAQYFDLDGPALAVDTACSSALVALHLARRSLTAGECDIALVGGVNLHLTPTAHRMLHAAQALSPTGRSRAFAAGADGFVPGEGGAVLVLRREEDARRAGDELLALVRGTAVNNDGTSLSLMAPNPARQREVITAAHASAGVDPAEVTYVEAHGTGTALGDPVELKSLAHAFPPLPGGGSRLLGSAKTNIGHLLNAAALPGLVKVVLALRHGRIPPSLHADPPSALLAESGFRVPDRLVTWPAPPSQGPLVAGINAFGFGGTNAHAVLQQATGGPRRGHRPDDGPHVLALSATTRPALLALVRELSAHLDAHPRIATADLCLTAATSRDDDRHRLALVCEDAGDVRARLAAVAVAVAGAETSAALAPAGEPAGEAPVPVSGAPTDPDVFTGTVRSRPRLAFLFPGQGAQRPGMAARLYATAPVFRGTLDEASTALGPLRGRTLVDWCTDPGVDPAELARTEITQPVLVAFGVALARQLGAWGVVPDAVTGHSVGELAAACAAGLLPLSDTVRFAAARGHAIAELTERGAMAAVLGADDAVAALVAAADGALTVAARNAPGRLVLSGTVRAVEDALAELAARGVTARRLRVSHGFHSPLMEPAARAVHEAAQELSPGTGRIPLLSTLTAGWVSAPDADHWREQALRPVRFGAAVRRLAEDGYDTFVEIGPGTDLPAALRRATADRPGPPVAVLSALPGGHREAEGRSGRGEAEGGSGRGELLRTIARLWTRGVSVDHAALAPTGRRVPLPTYPFQRRTYWPGPTAARLLHRVTWTPTPLAPPPAGGAPVTLVTGPDPEAVRELSTWLAERGVPTAHAGTTSAHTVVHLATRAQEAFDGPALAADFRDTVRQFDQASARRLLVLTEDAHATGTEGEARPRPEQALLTGLAPAFPQETEGARLVCVDLSSQDTGQQRLDAVLAEVRVTESALTEEWATESGSTSVAAWRRGTRLLRGTEPLPPTAVPDASGPLPADGVYLITGGAGGLGAALARDLAGRGRPTLVLTGRSPQPPTGLLDELAELGADARYRQADVTDERQLDALFARIPAPDVVFHAAGVVLPGSLRGTSPQDTDRALAAKAHGTRLLARALDRHGHRPGLCVAFSSVASVLPGAAGALGDYAAANAFLDAFAAAERAAGRCWLAVNLGPVARTGLAVALGEGTSSRAGGAPLAPTEAVRALRAACGVGTAQLVIADLTGADRSEQVSTPVSGAHTPTGPAESHPAPTTSTVPGDASDTRDLVRALLAEALQLPPEAVDQDQAFLALGLDSLAAVDLVRRLERALGRDLPATLFFEYRTVRELAAHLDARPAADGSGPAAPPHGDATVPAATAAEGVPFPLTPVQLALHTSSVLYPRTPARGWVRHTVRGPLDPALLRRALTTLAGRHGMLRVRIGHDGGVPHQIVTPDPEVWFETRSCPEGGAALQALETEFANRPLDLTAEPPVRALLVTEEAEVAHLILAVHHVAADGHSLNTLGTELWTLYTDLALGRTPSPLPPAPDFASYATDARRPAARADDLAHWTARLADHIPLPLPYDGRPDPETGPGPLVAVHHALDEELVATLRRHAAAWNVSLFHLLLAAYVRCLARWSGHRGVAVNVARAGRDARLTGLDRLVGPLADTLPMLLDTDPDEPLPRLAERVRLAWLESERHATVSSLDLARMSPGDTSGPRAVSPASFSFARFPATVDVDCPVDVRPTAAGTGSAATRLSLLVWEDGPLLRLSWNAPERLFTTATTTRHATDFEGELRALEGAAGSPDARDGSRAGVPGARALISGARAHISGAVPRATVVGRLLERFRTAPDAVAVDDGRLTLTYRDLDAATRDLALRLREQGVRRGDLVGMVTSPGPGTVIAVAGILRAGAGWVPLDAEYPAARLTEQTARCGVRVVVHDAPTRPAAEALTAVTAVPVTVDTEGVCATGPFSAPPLSTSVDDSLDGIAADLDATAYVIFTSGSTGRPKAVPISFRAMENYLDWAVTTFAYGPGDRLANTSSPCFDASVRQLLAPLLTGATVVTADRDLVRDPELLLDHVARARITVWSSVPSLWERLLAAAENRLRRAERLPDLSALRLVHVGGEVLWADWVRRWFDLFGPEQRIVNLYGPTETTINATYHVVAERPADEATALPIGRAVAGTELLVVGPGGEQVGPGGTGELLIGGVGLSAGYLGEPELTRAAFVWRDGRRWYLSGDRVEVLPDGALRFVGRIDDQVKIRGHRVEPGEVEAVLRARADVAQAAVLADGGRLSAFVALTAPEGRDGVDTVALRRYLGESLPPYMVPARIIVLDSLPLTGTGKTDRRALLARIQPPAPETPRASGASPKGTGATEERLGRIWCEVLGVDHVGRHDDFFELGGDSLLALQVFDLLARRHSGPLPRPTAVYRHRTLAALADAVDAEADAEAEDDAQAVDAEAIPVEAIGAEAAGEGEPLAPAQADDGALTPGDRAPSPPAFPDAYPLTPGQRGFLLAEALSPGSGASWLARLRLTGPLDRDRFQRAVDTLVARHPMLRTVFPAGARPVQQELPPSLRLPVAFETVSGPQELARRIEDERRRRFEPWAWPLLRLSVLTLTPREHVLVAHAHHLIGDGYSAALLLEELTTVHAALNRGTSPELPELRGTFREHAERLAERTAEPRAGRPAHRRPEEDGALRRRAGLSAPYPQPVLRTPAAGAGRRQAGASGTHTFLSHGFVLDATVVGALRKIAAEAGATLYAPLLTAYHQALATLTGQEDLVIGLAVSGRDHPLPDIHRVFGPFATAVAVRPFGPGDQAPPGDDFPQRVRRIVDETIAARVHEDIVPRDAGGLPLTSQFFFTFLDFGSLGPRSDDLLAVRWDEEEDSDFTPPAAGTDVFLAARPDGDRLRVTVRGAAAAFDEPALAAFAEGLRHRLVSRAVQPVRRSTRPGVQQEQQDLDAALVGYLPAPAQLARLAGLPETGSVREDIRRLLFPDGAPRLLETTATPQGRSGFVALPLFADELAGDGALAAHTARAVDAASALGARSVSLAGMIPSLTGYGFDVLRASRAPAAITTGHAATVVSVVRTVHAALAGTGRDLADTHLAVVGLGSIGASSLELLLTLAERPPARLVLCDVPGSGPRLRDLARTLRERGLADDVVVRVSDPGLPEAVYEAGLIVAAVSGHRALVDIDRLRPGTVVVDDSFPHCFDTGRALARMRERADVLVLGGGLLTVGTTRRTLAHGLPELVATTEAVARHGLPGTLASCRTESLLHASGADVPLVRGLVDGPTALAYWRAMEQTGITAAPPHLLGHILEPLPERVRAQGSGS